jgi:hypothetical protein
VLDCGVRAREEERLVPGISPADHVRRTTIWSVDLEHEGISIGFTDMMTLHDEAITNCCFHEPPPVAR